MYCLLLLDLLATFALVLSRLYSPIACAACLRVHWNYSVMQRCFCRAVSERRWRTFLVIISLIGRCIDNIWLCLALTGQSASIAVTRGGS